MVTYSVVVSTRQFRILLAVPPTLVGLAVCTWGILSDQFIPASLFLVIFTCAGVARLLYWQCVTVNGRILGDPPRLQFGSEVGLVQLVEIGPPRCAIVSRFPSGDLLVVETADGRRAIEFFGAGARAKMKGLSNK